MTVTISFQSTGMVPTGARPHQMVGSSLTLGRGEENDVVLPDPERVVSSRHAAIEERNGDVVIVDLSTNGTFVNYGKMPLGPVPTPLNDGDILVIGRYEILVSIKSGAGLAPASDLLDPLSETHHGVGDALTGQATADQMSLSDDDGLLNSLLGGPETPKGPSAVDRAIPDDFDIFAEPPDPSAPPPPTDFNAGLGASQSDHSPAMFDPMPEIKSAGSVIPEDWDDITGAAAAPAVDASPFAEPSDAVPATAPEPPIASPEAPPASQTAPEAPSPAAQPAKENATAAEPAMGHSDDVAVQAFMNALTGKDTDLSGEELVLTMTKLGHVTRILATGAREVLMTRTSIKGEFEIKQTVINASRNNPLKFSVGPEQAINALVAPNDPGYLDAVEAAEEAMDDIKSHEVAMVAGLEAALKNLLAQLAPETLAEQIETSGGLGSMFKGKKARYWEVYEKIYGQIADEAEENFRDIFGKAFATAYLEQMNRLGRK